MLVIIGLIVGGVLTGRALLNSGTALSITGESQRHLGALRQFKTQYGYLPGDFPRALSYWGTTKNGDGNRLIMPWDEMYALWQQLMLAGLVEGAYNGTYTLVSGRGVGVPNTNIPEGPFRNSGWSVIALATDPATNFEFGYVGGSTARLNRLVLGQASASEWANGVAVLAADAYAVDKKIDDGKPGTGNVLAGGCATGTMTAAVYPSDNATAKCRMAFTVK